MGKGKGGKEKKEKKRKGKKEKRNLRSHGFVTPSQTPIEPACVLDRIEELEAVPGIQTPSAIFPAWISGQMAFEKLSLVQFTMVVQFEPKKPILQLQTPFWQLPLFAQKRVNPQESASNQS